MRRLSGPLCLSGWGLFLVSLFQSTERLFLDFSMEIQKMPFIANLFFSSPPVSYMHPSLGKSTSIINRILPPLFVLTLNTNCSSSKLKTVNRACFLQILTQLFFILALRILCSALWLKNVVSEFCENVVKTKVMWKWKSNYYNYALSSHYCKIINTQHFL